MRLISPEPHGGSFLLRSFDLLVTLQPDTKKEVIMQLLFISPQQQLLSFCFQRLLLFHSFHGVINFYIPHCS